MYLRFKVRTDFYATIKDRFLWHTSSACDEVQLISVDDLETLFFQSLREHFKNNFQGKDLYHFYTRDFAR